MRCPKCKKDETRVIESRDVAEGESIRRRRECGSCNHRYTTYERIERPHLVVVKKDGTRQLFSREKLMTGLMRACEKTSVKSIEIEELIADVEKRLYEIGDGEVPSTVIGQLVMEELAKISDVAYVRFASVYRSFTDIESFERELDRLRDKLKQANKETVKKK